MGVDEIFYPGEPEYLKEQRLLKDGIDVEDSTWDKLKALADDYGLAEKLAF